MQGKRTGTYSSIFIISLLSIVGIVWLFYTEKTAAPPLPETTMPVVFNAQWDGSVWQIKDWLKKKAHNPSSLKVLHWGKVVDHQNGYTVLVKIKAKSPAGENMTFDKLFTLDPNGDIVGVMDIKPKTP